MRPIQLTMTAFGPYRDKEVINFEQLEEHQLFVISGQTGSGKTTIFDGICFALYGSASGEDRENNAMLRSDFADNDVHTSVELIFDQHGRRFRVLRQLGHVKAGNRTATGDKYELFEIVDDQEVPFVDRQMVSEINEKIEQLIGLTQDQFKQIVMLPQGEFRKLLTSETENKERILRRLFKTETYQQISDRLLAKKDKAESDYKEVEQRRNNYIHNIKATLGEREDSELFQVLNEEHFNVNQVLNGLQKEIHFYKAEVEKDNTAYEKAYNKHHKQQTAYHQAKAINERFLELEQKEAEFKKLQEQSEVFNEKEIQLKNGERASRIIVYENQVASWQKEHEEKKTATNKAKQAEKEAKLIVKQVSEAYDNEKQKETEREKTRKYLDELRQHLPTVKDIDERKRSLNIQMKQLKQQHEQIQNFKQTITTEKATNKETEEKIIKLEKDLSAENSKNERLVYLREKVRILRQFMKIREKHKELEQTFNREQQVFNQAQEKYRSLEKEWLTNQASMLATHLHDGEPCPVCGSDVHPQKASDTAGVVTRNELEGAKKNLDEHEKTYREAQVNLQANVALFTEQTERIQEYNITENEVNKAYEILVKEGKELKQEVEQLKKSRELVEQHKIKQKQVAEKITKLEEVLEKQTNEFQESRTVYEREKAVFDDRLEKVPEDIRVLAVLQEKIKQTETMKQAMEKAWEKVQKELQNAEQEQTKAVTNLANAQKQFTVTVTKLSEAEKEFEQEVKKAQFVSIEQYKASKMTDAQQEILRNEIEKYKQSHATLVKQIKELTTHLADKEKVDLSKLEVQLNQLKEAYEQAFHQRNTSAKHLEEAGKLHDNIKETDQLVAVKEKEFAMVTQLYNVTRGHNARRISFERYLQIDYLEQIIEAANSRLKHLSNGQFLLKRSERQEAYGRQSGLALDVYDSYTGQTRDVKTLSGGEKFNASLCLALGMSDVIQSFQGNVAIDTMFIDEGFGSLDEESLHKAIETLIDLQETGRMIGVISHVQELKTIFPAVLHVQKTREGYSQTQFAIK